MARSNRINAGQVVTVMVVAQINPLRNGSSVKELPANSMPITDYPQHDSCDIAGPDRVPAWCSRPVIA